MEDRPEPQASDKEKFDGVSEPSPELHSMHNSASSSTANDSAPATTISPNGAAATVATPKPSILKRAWSKVGINALVVMFMVKGALSPTIAIAIYQRYSVAVNYLNLGYVMIVVSILTVPVLPRGKYLMNLFVTLIMTCFGGAMVLFGQWLGVKARIATTPAHASLAVAHGYNSSASAINAIFMIINVFGIHALRAARPSLSIPAVQYTIFIMIGFVYGPQEPTEYHSIKFVKELLYSFLTGQAISTGVSLLIIPVSSRKVFFGEAAGFLQSSRGLLKAQLAFVEALEHSELCEPAVPKATSEPEDDAKKRDQNDEDKAQKRLICTQKAAALKAASAGVLGLSGKLRDDVVFARREVAYGNLGSSDIHEIYRLLRNILLPISSLSTVADISERLKNRYRADRRRFEESQCPEARDAEFTAKERANEEAEWRQLIRELHASFEPVVQVLEEGVLHIMILLGLTPTAKKPVTKAKVGVDGSAPLEDVEKGAAKPVPGDLRFGDFLDGEIQDFRNQRTERLQTWTKERGLDSVFHVTASTKHVQFPSQPSREGYKSLKLLREARASQRLHLILYMEYLLYSVARATLELVRFAELKVNDGTMRRNRLILPKAKMLYKWIKGLIEGDDSGGPDIDKMDHMTNNVVHLGDSLQEPKDPEHLPPKNSRQAFENHLRVVPRLLGSEAAKFGVRVTLAVMSIAIMAYLHQTHAFFIQQRIVWSLVMIAIGMNPTSGSAVFQLLGNLGFSLFGMISSFINWYIVDQKTPGIIVIFCLFMMFYFYLAAKYPRFLVSIVAGAITHVLVIGYELQVRVIGLKQATATGQPYYPIYELAPYRLFAVAGGVTVAYIWTIFPVPITEGSVLRRDLGTSLFLLANYVSSTTSTVEQRVKDKEGDMRLATSPGRMLQKIRQKVLQQQLALLNSMRQNLAFMAWEPTFGGDFPKEAYQRIIDEVQSVVNYLTVITYASEAFTNARINANSSQWLSQFAESRLESGRKSHELITLLSLLSASLKNKQPLPPYLKPPGYFNMFDQAVDTDPNILGLENINEPGFRAFAVIEVSHVCMVDSVSSIVKHVRDLVGEVDFSYQVVGNPAGTSGSAMDSASGKEKAH